MKTSVEEIYNKYEEFRNCKTKDEHADRFLAWFLCYKDNNLEKEKQAIIEANKVGFDNGYYYCKSQHALRSNLKYEKSTIDLNGERYFNDLKIR